MRRHLASTALVLLSCSLAVAGTPAAWGMSAAMAAEPASADPIAEEPYYDAEDVYIQPASIAPLFPVPPVAYDTPAFQKKRNAFTSQEEMMGFLQQLDSQHEHVRLEIIGQSLEGRDIPMLILSRHFDQLPRDPARPIVWLQAQIHGNEPAAGESALVMAKWLAEEPAGRELLDRLHVIIVPRINPDGSYRFTRSVATGLDANRDYMRAELPEVRAIHQAFDRFQPDVVLDAHEYSVKSAALSQTGTEGSLSSYDVLISSAKNLNIPKSLRTMADQLLLPEVQAVLDRAELTHHPYYTLARDDEGRITATEGSTETRIGRNALGLKNALSFLVETRGIGIGRADFERRVYGQVTAHQAFLQATAARAARIKQGVASARARLIEQGKKPGDDDPIIVTSENMPMAGQSLDVIDVAQAKRLSIPITWVSAADAMPTLERERPTAYLMPPAYHSIAERLEALGVSVSTLVEPLTLSVESYLVTNHQVKTTLENGRFPNRVETAVTERIAAFPAGSYVFFMDQPLANFIALALEPESVDSFVANGYLPVQTGDRIPVYRFMADPGILSAKKKTFSRGAADRVAGDSALAAGR
ncbi:M14 family metallopeptidase [Brevibacillus composti]|nr:M14 family metallocarboxypeptidase [Brevibacillus composti]